MSYADRRTNMTQFLRSLTDDSLLDTPMDYSVDDQTMAMYTNTEFYDYETGQNTDFQLPPAKPASESTKGEDAPANTSIIDDIMNTDFSMGGEYNFQDFNGNAYASPTITNFSDSIGNLQPIQPSPHTYQGIPAAQQQPPQTNGLAQQSPRAGERRSSKSPGRPLTAEEQGRVAAEEDKRRRNTAASARFRVKKKQREQALEKSAKEMTEKVNSLESRIQQLETENKWLKNIVLEKNDGNEDILSKLLEEHHAKNQSAAKDDAAKLKAIPAHEEKDAGDSSG